MENTFVLKNISFLGVYILYEFLSMVECYLVIEMLLIHQLKDVKFFSPNNSTFMMKSGKDKHI